jgi:hypothetical protein
MTGFADRFIGVATDWFLYALTEEYLFCNYKRAIVCAARQSVCDRVYVSPLSFAVSHGNERENDLS